MSTTATALTKARAEYIDLAGILLAHEQRIGAKQTYQEWCNFTLVRARLLNRSCAEGLGRLRVRFWATRLVADSPFRQADGFSTKLDRSAFSNLDCFPAVRGRLHSVGDGARQEWPKHPEPSGQRLQHRARLSSPVVI